MIGSYLSNFPTLSFIIFEVIKQPDLCLLKVVDARLKKDNRRQNQMRQKNGRKSSGRSGGHRNRKSN